MIQDPCCGRHAVDSPPSPRDHRGLEDDWASFCFRVWCHGKGQRRLCDTLSAVGNGGSINDNSLSNDESAASSHHVTYEVGEAKPEPRPPITTIAGERPSRSPGFRPCACRMTMALFMGHARRGVVGALSVNGVPRLLTSTTDCGPRRCVPSSACKPRQQVSQSQAATGNSQSRIGLAWALPVLPRPGCARTPTGSQSSRRPHDGKLLL